MFEHGATRRFSASDDEKWGWDTGLELAGESAAGEVAAVDGQGVSGDERCVVRREEERGRRYLFGFPDRPRRCCSLNQSSTGFKPPSCSGAVIGVSIRPGHKQFTRTLFGP